LYHLAFPKDVCEQATALKSWLIPKTLVGMRGQTPNDAQIFVQQCSTIFHSKPVQNKTNAALNIEKNGNINNYLFSVKYSE